MRSIKFALNQEEQSRKGVYEKLQVHYDLVVL